MEIVAPDLKGFEVSLTPCAVFDRFSRVLLAVEALRRCVHGKSSQDSILSNILVGFGSAVG